MAALQFYGWDGRLFYLYEKVCRRPRDVGVGIAILQNRTTQVLSLWRQTPLVVRLLWCVLGLAFIPLLWLRREEKRRNALLELFGSSPDVTKEGPEMVALQRDVIQQSAALEWYGSWLVNTYQFRGHIYGCWGC